MTSSAASSRRGRRILRSMSVPALQPFFDGWAKHEALVLDALRDLTPEQLDLRTAPHQWAIWQLAAHVAGSRSYWFHDILGEGDAATRDLFRVDRTTVAGVSPDAAGREDGDGPPSRAEGLGGALRA